MLNYLFRPAAIVSFQSQYDRCGFGCALGSFLEAFGHVIVLILFIAAMLIYLRFSYRYGVVGRRIRWTLLLPVAMFGLPFLYELGMETLWPKCDGRGAALGAALHNGALALLGLQVFSGLPVVLVASGHRLGASTFALAIGLLGFCFTLLMSFPFYIGDCASIPR
jgi:hypothetical protein